MVMIQLRVSNNLPRTRDIKQNANWQTNHKAKKPDIEGHCQRFYTPRTSHIIGSDITQYLYFYMVFLQPGNGGLRILFCSALQSA